MVYTIQTTGCFQFPETVLDPVNCEDDCEHANEHSNCNPCQHPITQSKQVEYPNCGGKQEHDYNCLLNEFGARGIDKNIILGCSLCFPIPGEVGTQFRQ